MNIFDILFFISAIIFSFAVIRLIYIFFYALIKFGKVAGKSEIKEIIIQALKHIWLFK